MNKDGLEFTLDKVGDKEVADSPEISAGWLQWHSRLQSGGQVGAVHMLRELEHERVEDDGANLGSVFPVGTHVFPNVQPTVSNLVAQVLQTQSTVLSHAIVSEGLLLIGER